jgi:F-type H+-transporting ATPase subunit b
MEEIFNPVSLALHMLNTAILGVAAYFLLWKPVSAFILKRGAAIKSDIDSAAERRRKAEDMVRESERVIENAERRASETIAKAADTAERRAAEIISKAHADAARLKADAEADIEKQRVKVQEALRDESAKLALELAEKLIGRDITAEDNTRLIDSLLERM